MLLRRTPARSTPAPAATELPPEKRMRKVWRAGKEGLGGEDDPYWWVNTFTTEEAIKFIAREAREPIRNFTGHKE